MTVRGGEAMAAKRTAAQGVRSEMPRPILRGKLQKVGPMIGQPGFAAGEMRPNGSKRRVLPLGTRRGAGVTGTAK